MEITKDTVIGDLVYTYPDSMEILMSYGMPCIGCPASQLETVEEAAMVHGLDLDLLLVALKILED